MERSKRVYSIIVDIWKVISKYKESDISQDAECKAILSELQVVCDMYRQKVGEEEGVLARKVAALVLEYLCERKQI